MSRRPGIPVRPRPKADTQEHVFVKPEGNRTMMLCPGCSYEQEVRLPLPVDQFCDILEGFQRRHASCRKGAK